MSGTKMSLRRYGGGEFQYWEEQEIIVDEQYLALNGGLFLHLDYEYRMGTKQLDVYFNGAHLLEGGGYGEIDPTTIRLDLGTYEGDTVYAGLPIQLQVGDEIFIRTWKPEYREGNGNIDELRFKALEEEVRNARKYKDGDSPHPNLDTRLDSIERQAEVKTMFFVLSRVFDGVAKIGEMRFPHAGQITEVYASALKPGTGRTVFKIERCSQTDYDTTPVWTNIFSQDLVVEANEKSSNTTPYAVALPYINKNDHYRVFVSELGAGIEGVTIEVMVTI